MADTVPPPAEPLDDDLLAPFGGAEPMGPSLDPARLMEVESEVPRADPRKREDERDPRSAETAFNHDAAVSGFAKRREVVLDLLGGTRDLRLYIRLAQAMAWTDGPLGLHAGLHAVDAMVRGHWQDLHPGPADDAEAVTQRVRAFAPLRDPLLIIAFLPVEVFDARERDGPITLRMIYHAAGRHEASRMHRPGSADTVYPAEGMHGLVARVGAGPEIAAMRAALTGSALILRGLQALFAETPGFEAVRFTGAERRRGLVDELEDFAAALAAFETESAGAPASEAGAATEEAAPAAGDAPAAAAAPPPPADLPTRADAMALIDAVLGYFAVSARSSPIALGLMKIRAMETATFAQWLEETVGHGGEWATLPLWGIEPHELDACAVPPEDAAAEEAPPPGPEAPLAALEAAETRLNALAAAAGAAAAEAAAEGEEAPTPAAAVDPAALTEIAAALAEARAAIAALPAPAAPPRPARIADRPAVRAALTSLARHWRATEPSSPATLALEKMGEMVDLPFMDVVRQVAAEDVARPALRLARNPARE